MPTPEEYAAAARNAGGTGTPIAQHFGQERLGFDPLALVEPAPPAPPPWQGPPPLPAERRPGFQGPPPQGPPPWQGPPPMPRRSPSEKDLAEAASSDAGIGRAIAMQQSGNPLFSDGTRFVDAGGPVVVSGAAADAARDTEAALREAWRKPGEESSASSEAPARGTAPIVSRGVGPGFDDRRVPFRKGTVAAMKQQIANEGEAQAQAAVAERVSLQEQGAYLAEAEEAAQRRHANVMAREQQRQLALELEQQKVSQAMADAKKATATEGSFLERNPGSLLMVAGAALGGVLSARTGQPNTGMQMLDTEIDRIMAEQKFKASRADAAVAHQTNLVGMMRSRFDDERQADTAAERAMRQEVDDHLTRLGLKEKDRDVQAKIGLLKEQNAGKLIELDARLDQYAHHAAYGGQAAMNQNLFVPGLQGYARTEKEAQELRDKGAAVQQIQANLGEMAKVRDQTSAAELLAYRNTGYKSENVAKLLQLQADTAPFVGVFKGQGALGDAEREHMNQAMGGVMDVTGNPTARAREAAQRIGKNYAIAGQSYGIAKGQEAVAPNPTTGRLEVRGQLTGEMAPRPVVQKAVKREAVK